MTWEVKADGYCRKHCHFLSNSRLDRIICASTQTMHTQHQSCRRTKIRL